MNNELEKIFRKSHSNIIDSFKSLEKSKKAIITLDKWKRPEGGGGKTFTIQKGTFFDNCAVNFSSIKGKKLPQAALGNSMVKSSNNGYQAMGVSVISHPKNPYVPSSHMNIRLFCILGKNGEIKDWWSGGGYDLTPFFPYKTDCIQWHKDAKDCLDQFNKSLYNKFAKNCNEYFYIPHRKERRGIGGIFFDNFSKLSLDKTLSLLSCTANQYKNSYNSIASKRDSKKYTTAQKDFQLFRRGRYAEFNLTYDRGTAFGLQSNGRIESILASLPSDVKWSYKKDKDYLKMEKRLLSFINKDWNV
ncbi:oxygen-dependent coproporphyrinogen oxidase [Gammaproteobacteria bacterium]|jgi:coproporphyrinogen III oxidase|nr:oxygen-dependent coproporphyrinogen oxidase [Gammaproteobacteria bacterium]